MNINGKLIREKREAIEPKLSQEALARQAGVSTQTIRNLEIERGGATVDTLRAVAEVLGCTMDELVTD